MKKLLILFISLCISSVVIAQGASDDGIARWLRNPAISPDGKTIVFGYMGNLYSVSADGGVAVPLTVGDDYKQNPVWSNDGEMIAFASDRHGNFDVYVMPSKGGQAKRITHHSAHDTPYAFTKDNSKVLFGSNREGPASSVRFPGIRYFANLYTVPAVGGREVLVTSAGAEQAHYNRDNNQIVFQDIKGYEDYHRKHHTSAVTRDIWIYDINADSYKQITTYEGENRDPFFSKDGKSVFYTNEKSGDLNIYKKDVASNASVQLTKYKDFPVREMSISADDKIAYVWKGDIYTMEEGKEPVKLKVQIYNDAGYNAVKNVSAGRLTEFKVSPSGKEIAYVSRGEVFVTGVDNKYTKRITNTPGQERMIEWAPDGETLVFAGEIDNKWHIYKATLKYPEEKFFHVATTINVEPLIATSAEEFYPKYSPDGKKIAYIENRNILKVLDIETGVTVTVLPEGRNYSYRDGDWGFTWSPDSKWLLVDDDKGYFTHTNTALLSADGKGETVYPVNGGFGEYGAKWAMEGKVMTYKSTKLGRKSLAYQGSKESDIYAVFFDTEAYDEFTLSEDDYKLKKELDKKDKKDEDEDNGEDGKDKKGKKDKKDKKEKKEVEPLKFDLDNLRDRIVRLTITSASLSDYVLSDDGSKLYYLAAYDKGFDLWQTEPRTRETKVLAKLDGGGSSLQLSDDGKFIFLSSKGSLKKIELSNGKSTTISTGGDMELDLAAEREYIFDHMWRQVKEKFYDPAIHNIDWEMYHREYAAFLPHVNNNYDFQVLLSEMLGELNASHTGARYSPSYSDADQTGAFGLLYDESYAGEGIKITDVIPGGPMDKSSIDVKKGDFIVAINDKRISADEDWNQYMNNTAGKKTLVTIKRGAKTFNLTIKPISLGAQNNLMYKRWIAMMEQMTDSLSNGQVGYVHVRGMNDGSFRDVYDIVMGRNIDKKALLVDTRFNGGGWLHNDLNTFLSGKEYLKFAPQGNVTKGGEPVDRWTKPSIVVMSEGNYSDAHIFPYVYKQNGIGKLVGMPVAGTGTAVWWERQIDPTLVFGIPMVATIGAENRATENLDLEPDIKVPLPFGKCLNGEDPQLERGVQELLKMVE